MSHASAAPRGPVAPVAVRPSSRDSRPSWAAPSVPANAVPNRSAPRTTKAQRRTLQANLFRSLSPNYGYNGDCIYSDHRNESLSYVRICSCKNCSFAMQWLGDLCDIRLRSMRVSGEAVKLGARSGLDFEGSKYASIWIVLPFHVFSRSNCSVGELLVRAFVLGARWWCAAWPDLLHGRAITSGYVRAGTGRLLLWVPSGSRDASEHGPVRRLVKFTTAQQCLCFRRRSTDFIHPCFRYALGRNS